MNENNIVESQKEHLGEDLLTEVARAGARRMLAYAIEEEVKAFIHKQSAYAQAGPQELVRNGFLPQRHVQTSIGPIPVRVPRVRDRAQQGRRFHSQLLPPYQRRTLTLTAALPILYLKGLSTGQFPEALEQLFGCSSGLSAATICRLKSAWQQEYESWLQRDLSQQKFVYIWADGIYFSTRLESDKQCLLVIIGVDEQGNKVPLGISDGVRESSLSWKELLLQLKQQGLQAPLLATADGALGFWKALQEVYPTTQHQRCWVHKTGNVLNKLPQSLHSTGKRHLQRIWGADTKQEAQQEIKRFTALFESKYPKAVSSLENDQEELLKFFDFPAGHWRHIRTTNLIESTFATVRLRTHKTKGCLSRTTALSMVFKLIQTAQSKWKRLQHANELKQLLQGEKFVNGKIVKEESCR